jgi:hypothetical protein
MATMTSAGLRSMLNSTPSRPILGVDGTAVLLETLNECATTCIICADACLGEDMVAEMRRCITLDLSCADTCAAMARMAARPTGAAEALWRVSLQHCAEVCTACAAECELHAGMMEHCRICAESCRRCEQACREARGRL